MVTSGPGTTERLRGLTDPGVLTSLFVCLLLGAYLLLSSTTAPIGGLWLYDAKRLMQFGLLAVLFLAALMDRSLRSEIAKTLGAVPRWVKILLLAVLAWGTLSSIVNAGSFYHGMNSLSEVALFTTLVLAVFVVAACRRIAGSRFDYLALAVISLTGLAVGIQELLGVLAAKSMGQEFTYRSSLLYFGHPRFYNQLQSWMVPVLTAIPLLFSRNLLVYSICLVVLGLQWYIIVMTGARGSFLSIIVALGLVAALIPGLRKPILIWQSAGLILGALIYTLVLVSFEYPAVQDEPGSELRPPEKMQNDGRGFYGNENDKTSSFFAQSLGRPMASGSGRLWMWRIAGQNLAAEPLLGIGPMNYACTSPEPISHPHNFLLQLAAEWGLAVSAAILMLALYVCVKCAAWLRFSLPASTPAGLFAGLLAAAVVSASLHSLLSGVFVMPASQIMAVLICGTLLGSVPLHAEGAPRRLRYLPALFGLLLALGVFVTGQHELQNPEYAPAATPSSETLHPRMWQNQKACVIYMPQNSVKS